MITTDSSTELLWGNSELVSYYNDALDKLMDKVWMLIPDSTTAEDLADTPLPLCELDIVAGNQIYDISSKIIKIRRIKISGQSRPLEEISYDSLISAYPNWEDETGTPQRFTLQTD